MGWFYYSNQNETRTKVKGNRHPSGIFCLFTTLYDLSSSELKCSCCSTGHLNVHSVLPGGKSPRSELLSHLLRKHVPGSHPEVSGPKAIHPTAGLRMGLLETGQWSANAVNRPQPLNCKAGPNPVLSHTVGAQQGRELGGSFTRAGKTDKLLC